MKLPSPDVPYQRPISHPMHPATVMVHTHYRAIPCCDAHARGKIKWCNAVGYKPEVSPAPFATACEGCRAEEYHRNQERVQ